MPCEAPAGVFQDCVQVEARNRVDADTTLVNTFTFAPGVGLVRIQVEAERGGRRIPQTWLELTSYQVEARAGLRESMKEIGIALLGLGNVGLGTYRILADHARDIERRLGARVRVRHILVKDAKRARPGGCALGAHHPGHRLPSSRTPRWRWWWR